MMLEACNEICEVYSWFYGQNVADKFVDLQIHPRFPKPTEILRWPLFSLESRAQLFGAKLVIIQSI